MTWTHWPCRADFAHWLLRLPLSAVLPRYGIRGFPLSDAEAAGFGVPLAPWARAGLGRDRRPLLLLRGGLRFALAGNARRNRAGA